MIFKRVLLAIATIAIFISSNVFALNAQSSINFDLPSCYSSSESLSEAIANYQQNNPLVIKINTLLNESVIACESGQFKLGYQHLINAGQLYEKLKLD